MTTEEQKEEMANKWRDLREKAECVTSLFTQASGVFRQHC